jgi:hypothetical protein
MSGTFPGVFSNTTNRPPRSADENVNGISGLSKVNDRVSVSCVTPDSVLIIDIACALNSFERIIFACKNTVIWPGCCPGMLYLFAGISFTADVSTEGADRKFSVWDVYKEFPISLSVLHRFT